MGLFLIIACLIVICKKLVYCFRYLVFEWLPLYLPSLQSLVKGRVTCLHVVGETCVDGFIF